MILETLLSGFPTILSLLSRRILGSYGSFI